MKRVKSCEWIFSAALIFLPGILNAESSILDRVIENVQRRFESTELFKIASEQKTALDNEKHCIFLADTKKAKVLTFISGAALIQMIEGGEFKNQHQTGYSGGGTFAPKGRYELEAMMAGKNLRKLIPNRRRLNQFLPKYGLVEFHDFANHPEVRETWPIEMPAADDLDTYGEIAIYFRDSIKDRTTFAPTAPATLIDGGKKLVIHSGAEKYIQSLRQKKIILSLEQIDEGTYFEAHMWGKVSLPDIAYIVVPDELFYDTSATIEEIEVALKRTGIPVFRFKKWSKQDRISEQLRIKFRGSQLFSENRRKRARYESTHNCTQILRRISS